MFSVKIDDSFSPINIVFLNQLRNYSYLKISNQLGQKAKYIILIITSNHFPIIW